MAEEKSIKLLFIVNAIIDVDESNFIGFDKKTKECSVSGI